MVILLLVTAFVIAFAVAAVVVLIFAKPMDRILRQIVSGELAPAWLRYLCFAMYVVGIGGGVRVWALEKYMTRQEPYRQIVALTPERWMLEIYETIIGTLQSTTAVLLAFFVFALVAVVTSGRLMPGVLSAPRTVTAKKCCAKQRGIDGRATLGMAVDHRSFRLTWTTLARSALSL